MFKTVLRNIDLIQTNKDTILDMWLEYEIVEQKLLKNSFNVKFFREKFALKVFEYAISVANSENKVGNCPVIGVMLMLFKRKNIPLSDIFIICVHLKNALLHFCLQKSLLDEDMLKEISEIMDYNFEGVIHEYITYYYKDAYKQKERIKCETKPVSELKEDAKPEVVKEVVSESPDPDKTEVVKVTSAKDYLLDIDIDYEMVAELDELESEVLDSIYSHEYITADIMEESSQLFEQYSRVLNTLYEFEELSYTLTILKDLLLTSDLDTMDNETVEIIGAYLKAIIGDLKCWRMAVFITYQAEDIHYLDKTLLSSIAQLQITLMPQDEAAEDEIDFFF